MLTAVARPVRRELIVRAQPGIVERSVVVFVLFISQFGTPTDWFAPRLTVGFSGNDSNPLLVFGILSSVAILSLGLVGNGEAIVKALRLEPLLVAFVGVVVLSALWSSNPLQGVSDVANFLLATQLGLILFVRYRPREVAQLVIVGLTAGIALHVLWVFTLPGYGQLGGAWVGVSVNKNFLGSQAVQAIPFFFLIGRAEPRWRHPLYLMGLVSIGLVIGSTSKTSLASGILTVAATVVFVAFRARKTLYGAVVVVLASTSVVAALFATANLGLLAEWLDKDPSLTGRTQMWPIIIGDILDKPWLGYGYGGYWNGYLSPAHDVWVYQRWFPGHAHNAALEVAVRVGLVGLGLLAIANVRAMMRATRQIREVPGPLALLPLVFFTLVLMASITESGVVPQRFGWTMSVYFTLVVGHTYRAVTQQAEAGSNGRPGSDERYGDSIAPTSMGPLRGRL